MDVSRLLPAVARKSIVRKYGLLVLLVLVVTGLLTAAIVTGVGESVRDNRQTIGTSATGPDSSRKTVISRATRTRGAFGAR